MWIFSLSSTFGTTYETQGTHHWTCAMMFNHAQPCRKQQNNTWDLRPIFGATQETHYISCTFAVLSHTHGPTSVWGKAPYCFSPQVPQKPWRCTWIFKRFHGCSSWTTMSSAFFGNIPSQNITSMDTKKTQTLWMCKLQAFGFPQETQLLVLDHDMRMLLRLWWVARYQIAYVLPSIGLWTVMI